MTLGEQIVAMTDGIYGSLDHVGGLLECQTCGRRQPMQQGDSRNYLRNGWPRCCEHTMRWWTRRQIDAGEVSV